MIKHVSLFDVVTLASVRFRLSWTA